MSPGTSRIAHQKLPTSAPTLGYRSTTAWGRDDATAVSRRRASSRHHPVTDTTSSKIRPLSFLLVFTCASASFVVGWRFLYLWGILI